MLSKLWQDQVNFYSDESLILLASGFAVGGVVANTDADARMQYFFHTQFHSTRSDEYSEFLHFNKELGDHKYTLPFFAATWAVGHWILLEGDESPVTIWGSRAARGMLVGAPATYALQRLIGGSRPTESLEASEWRPFKDTNDVSGHAFVGTLPFITAAKLSESIGAKIFWYAGSALVPLSRMNDNAHFPSQAFLGWWVAYLASSAVAATDAPNSRWRLMPYSNGNSFGLGTEIRF